MSTDSQIIEMSVQDELKTSFLSYAMSVIVSRALPDVRDGLKPVHRRILYTLAQMNLRPNASYVKCARVVGEAMGKYHPHGDTAIYDSLVRMAQDWSMRVPLVDGHGNFGTHTDPPAAMRYTESRMAKAALPMTDELDEETVDFEPNYDGKFYEPTVLPSAFPNLLVNGVEGIAVGMATNMPPHNLVEAIAASKHVLMHPDATVEDVMAFVPAPDLPTGGIILGLDGVAEAYRTGRGKFTMRSRTHFEDITARRKSIVVTELPYQVGPEHVIEDIKKHRDAKKLAGVAAVTDLTDRKTGLRMVIECKAGFQPQAVLDELLRLTRLQTNFSVHNLALVDGRPRTLSLLEIVRHFVDHRVEVTTRRCEFRRRKARTKAHLLEGYVIALAKIEEVIAIIKKAKDTASAREALTKKFKLDDVQAAAILEMPLRRLTSLEVEKLKAELAELHAQIAELTRLLESQDAMRELISSEMDAVAATHGTPRRSELSGASPVVTAVNEAAARIPEEVCSVTVSATGLISHWTAPFTGARSKHDAVVASVASNTHATIGVLTSRGRVVYVPVMEIPAGAGKDRGGPLSDFVQFEAGEKLVALLALGDDAPSVAMATREGVVKVVAGGDLPKKSDQEVIGLKDGDELIGAVAIPKGEADLVFICSDTQLLRTPVSGVRPQGRAGGGVAGVKLADGSQVIAFAVVPAGDDDLPVVTVAGGSGPSTVKVTPVGQYPAKGRGTGGVRAHRLLRGEDRLVAAAVGHDVTGVAANGALVALPAEVGKRDGAGVRTATDVASLAVRR